MGGLLTGLQPFMGLGESYFAYRNQSNVLRANVQAQQAVVAQQISANKENSKTMLYVGMALLAALVLFKKK